MESCGQIVGSALHPSIRLRLDTHPKREREGCTSRQLTDVWSNSNEAHDAYLSSAGTCRRCRSISSDVSVLLGDLLGSKRDGERETETQTSSLDSLSLLNSRPPHVRLPAVQAQGCSIQVRGSTSPAPHLREKARERARDEEEEETRRYRTSPLPLVAVLGLLAVQRKRKDNERLTAEKSSRTEVGSSKAERSVSSSP